MVSSPERKIAGRVAVCTGDRWWRELGGGWGFFEDEWEGGGGLWRWVGMGGRGEERGKRGMGEEGERVGVVGVGFDEVGW